MGFLPAKRWTLRSHTLQTLGVTLALVLAGAAAAQTPGGVREARAKVKPIAALNPTDRK